MRIDVVSASAGTGKTHRLTKDLTEALLDGSARPEGVVAITYTVKAANELESRIRSRLLEDGRVELAGRIRDGYIGTIHAICQRLLREFALEAGLSPYLEPIPETERQRLFSVALAPLLAGQESRLNELAGRLELEDWKGVLLDLVDRARANGMDRGALRRSGEQSRKTLKKLLGKATLDAESYLERLKAAHQKLQPKLEELAGDSDAAKKRAERGRGIGKKLGRNALPSWKDQHQFAAELPKKLSAWSEDLVVLVQQHPACAAFQDDVLGLQQALFELAAEALEVFVAEKSAAGVLDFGDMLAQAREVLGRPAVQEALRARLDLVLVDEFQDTSPLQLAVVSALGALAKRSIWVGDRKQAIFGFQGSDPELMTAAADAALGGRAPDILGQSWRSRPAIVQLVSDLFSASLGPHGFPPEQVRVAAAKKDPSQLAEQPAFECWRWVPDEQEIDGLSIRASEPQAIAAGIELLLATPPLVRQRTAGRDERVRPASHGDIAVLARSNTRCRQIAEALRTRGIPAKVSLSGVTHTPEGVLARAALALLADPQDGLAALEVAWLGGAATADPDGWLSGRLLEVARWREANERAEAKGEPGSRLPPAFEDDPQVAGLRKAAAEAARLSPAQALDLALRVAAIPERVRAWPEPGQRLANLEAVRALALTYEQLCEAQRSPATMLGLVAHLGGLEEDDEEGAQAASSSEDAITVCTWHKAKGLEWPVVILSHLDHSLERGPFKVSVEPAAEFDFARPLDGRWVRWWPWPYGKMSKGLELLDRAARTPEAARAASADERERLRLLYVGFTRPRDLLVLVAQLKKNGPSTQGLELLRDAEGAPLLEAPFEAEAGANQLRVEKVQWDCTVRELPGLPPGAAAPKREPVRWYASAPRAARPEERLNPSAEPLVGKPRIVGVERLGRRKSLSAGPEQAGPLGDAIHGFLAADEPGDASSRLAMAQRLLKGFGITGAVAPETLLKASDALRTWLNDRYPGGTWYREWPVRARLAVAPPRLLVGEVDLFLDLPDGFVLVDHKSFPGTEKERDRRLLEEYAPQLGWYARTLAQALGKPMKAAFIHLPVRGEIAQVELG